MELFKLQKKNQMQDCEKILYCENYEHRNYYQLALSFYIAVARHIMKTLNINQK